MNDEFTDLEAELQSLRPRAPVRELHRRLATELDGASPAIALTPRKTGWRWRLVLWPAAAALVVALTVSAVWSRRGSEVASAVVLDPATATPSEVYKPVSAENLLFEAHDEGVVTLSDGMPGWRVRERSLDTFIWQNPRTKASLRWTVPREEVLVVPLAVF
ncbi:MAG: hypothetical protein HZA31_13480 [Opitutae bacterium]|nr:hypothetical protein [Opitutae bacterium]